MTRRLDKEHLERLLSTPGLCASCRHARLAVAAEAVYLRCILAERDAAYARYPRLPIWRCLGFEAEGSVAADPGPT